MTKVQKIVLGIAIVTALVLTSWFLNHVLNGYKTAKLEKKIEKLEEQLKTSDQERNIAVGQRDAYKAQSDAINPKLDALQQRTNRSDSKLTSIQVGITQERKNYADAKNIRRSSNIGIDVMRDDACAELKRAGLIPADDSCK